ncbi:MULTISPECIES: L-aspartate oxidase [Phyllobacteriaceae]|jgi:L-aspartate oxidase|uniref:L-aspartate oxidase n=1 Tax=Mesorhizobium hungaricum TaxID=1566387 RepID=A0A1C2DYV4_9HYPH|nr:MULTISPECIES: L-aspartate oxidase [Mesorhizobium]MBN9234636.1 L-aspartate oxidase [Mesorhizobium sp.]OCX19928.1 L-aspartate oxidase [Mesorhizobium hungaricum]
MSADRHDLAGRPVIIGAGIAGLMTALELAPLPVVLMSAAPLGGEASSPLAQGGMAAALGSDDSTALHLADTCNAGDGLCDVPVARRIVEAAPKAIERLERLGVVFDRNPSGGLALGLEAAHSRRRIVHAGGDATGRELIRALVAAVRATPSITVFEDVRARRLLIEDGSIAGVIATSQTASAVFATDRVVLATGGIGSLYHDTTNPLGCFGQGLALAARAGAELADLEFVQFHPTALDTPARPMPLVSEAVRGEGAVLIDEIGQRFLADLPGAELASRDTVARAVFRHLAKGHRVFLDTRDCLVTRFAERFPAIAAFCHEAGIDPAFEPIPIRPAAHYHMGGVAVDDEGRSSVPGLWACGEVASTGLHGANRLASNSLTEAVVCAEWVARSVASASGTRIIEAGPAELLPPPAPGPVRDIVSATLGVVRNGDELRGAVARLAPLATGKTACADPAAVALMMAVSALRRKESRGAHFRSDFPTHTAPTRRARLTLDAALAADAELDPAPLARSA